MYVGPYSSEPLDIEEMGLRRILPRLEKLIIRWDDHKSFTIQDSYERGCRQLPLPFEVEHRIPGTGDDGIIWEGTAGWYEHIDSPEELAAIWDS